MLTYETVRMGNIGEPVRRIEFEPIPETAPAEAPAQTPEREPVPAGVCLTWPNGNRDCRLCIRARSAAYKARRAVA